MADRYKVAQPVRIVNGTGEVGTPVIITDEDGNVSELPTATEFGQELLAAEDAADAQEILELNVVTYATSFPGSPTTGQRVLRTDRNIEYFYDGTRWLSSQLFLVETRPDTFPMTASGNIRARNPFAGVYDIYVEKVNGPVSQTSADSAANYFVFQLYKEGGSSVTLGTTFSTQNDTNNAWVGKSVTINAVVDSTFTRLTIDAAKTGTSTMYPLLGVQYRLVG